MFYWVTVLFTFALGTAAGDLISEKLNMGYWNSALIFGGVIAAVFFAHRRFQLNAILSFWIAYVPRRGRSAPHSGTALAADERRWRGTRPRYHDDEHHLPGGDRGNGSRI